MVGLRKIRWQTQKEIAKKYEQSVQLQRNGDLEGYGRIMKEIEDLEKQLKHLRRTNRAICRIVTRCRSHTV